MKPFIVAACQVRAFDIEAAEENLANILRTLDEAGTAGADLVLLPECAYPAYYLKDGDPYARPNVRPYAEVAALFGGKAKEYGYWLAAGMAVPHGDGAITNSGVVFGPDGEERGRYDKSFLWHFDRNWFRPGGEFPVFDTGFCRFGILICADGRVPEIARMLAVNGAEIICDLTAWVSWARTTEALTTTQCEYLMPARAYENGVWVAAADKWGTEDGTIVYAGRSTVIDPLGEARVCAASGGDTVVTYRVEPMAVETVPRRPSLYRLLTQPTEGLAAVALEHEPLVPSRSGARVAVVPSDTGFNARRTIERYLALRRQDADLVVFGGVPGPDGWELELPELQAAVDAHGGAMVVAVTTTGCDWRQTAAIIQPGKMVEHTASHGRGVQTGELLPPVVTTVAGNVGLLIGDEGYVPEVARILALQGADILAWPLFEAGPMAERVARSRSDENRVFTAAAWPDGGLVANPDGGLLTAVPAGTGVAMTASVHLAASRWKERAPGTHVIRDRLPAAYGALTK